MNEQNGNTRNNTSRWNLQSLILFAAIVLSFWLIYRLRWVLTPFVLGFLTAYILTPVVDWLERRGFSRLGSVIILSLSLLLLVILAVGMVVPPTVQQFNQVIADIPEYKDWVVGQVQHANRWGVPPYLQEEIREGLNEIMPALQRSVPLLVQKAGSVTIQTLAGAFGMMGVAINLGVFVFVTIYLLHDYYTIRDRLITLIPLAWKEEVFADAEEIDRLLRAFLRGQLIVVLFLSIWYAIGLSVIGLKLGVLVGILAGIFCIIPYLGNVLGGGTALMIALYQGAQQGDILTYVLGVLIVFILGQSIEGNLVTPNVVGRSVGLSPVAVIFALMAGGELFGFVGLLAAVPLACVVKVLGGRILTLYQESRLYREGELSLRKKED